MNDLFGTITLIVAVTAFSAIIAFEFAKAFRAGTIAQSSAGRITWATGFVLILVMPVAYPALKGSGANSLWWFGAGMIGLGFLMELMGERAKRSRSSRSSSSVGQ